MNCEIITIGDEYLFGKADNSSALRISEYISGMGFDIKTQTVVSSGMNQLTSIFNAALRRSQLLIVIGGISGMHTVSSRETIARALNIKMVNNIKVEQKIKEHYDLRGERFFNDYAKLSQFPKNSIIFPNDIGIAYGSCIDFAGHKIIILPDETKELDLMFTKYVVPHIEPLTNGVYSERSICLFDIDVDVVERKLNFNFETAGSRITTTQKGGCITINLMVKGKDKTSADLACEELVTKIKNAFYNNVCSTSSDDLAASTVSSLIKANKKISTAESCTAGMLSQMLTDVPGSSKVFEFGISAYSNRIKTDALGVPTEIIERYGAISAQTAILMAKNVREMSSADIGIGITGVAGPGTSENKAVGTIYIAMADKQRGWVRLIKPSNNTDREYLRILSCNTALDLIRRYMAVSDFGVLDDSFDIEDLSTINVVTKNPSIGVPKETAIGDATTSAKSSLSNEEILKLVINNNNTDINNDGAKKLEVSAENIFLLGDSESDNDDTPDLVPLHDIKKFVVDSGLEDQTESQDEGLTDDTDNDAFKPLDKKLVASDTMGRILSFIAGILMIIFPNKNDSLKKILLKLLCFVLAIAFIITGCVLINSSTSSKAQREFLDNIQKQWDDVSLNQSKTNGVFNSFSFLTDINPDTVGWLKINNTEIDFPVVLSDNNEFYLNHDINKNKSKYGTIFADKNVIIQSGRKSQNITLYGNNCNDGSMFAELKNYKQIDYYRSHPTVSFKTLYRDNVYKIFSIFIINTDPYDDNSYAFNFAKSAFSDRADFIKFVAEARVRSIIDTKVDVIEEDELLTLCTNTSEFKGARLIIMARRVRDNENYAVDTHIATVNPNPVYPAVWYETKGLDAPDTTSIITNAQNSVSSTPSNISSDLQSASSEEQSSDTESSSTPSSSNAPVINQSSKPSTTTSRPTVSDTSSQPTASDDSSLSETPDLGDDTDDTPSDNSSLGETPDLGDDTDDTPSDGGGLGETDDPGDGSDDIPGDDVSSDDGPGDLGDPNAGE